MIRSKGRGDAAARSVYPMFELHDLFEFIRYFRLLKYLCLIRSRFFSESHAWTARVLRSSIGAANSFALLRNQCGPDFSLNRTGPVLIAYVYKRASAAS